MSDLDAAAMEIIKANRQARADFRLKSAQLVSAILAETDEQLDDFNTGLENEVRDILERSGEDSAVGGTDSSGGDAGDSGGDTQESGSGI